MKNDLTSGEKKPRMTFSCKTDRVTHILRDKRRSGRDRTDGTGTQKTKGIKITKKKKKKKKKNLETPRISSGLLVFVCLFVCFVF